MVFAAAVSVATAPAAAAGSAAAAASTASAAFTAAAASTHVAHLAAAVYVFTELAVAEENIEAVAAAAQLMQ